MFGRAPFTRTRSTALALFADLFGLSSQQLCLRTVSLGMVPTSGVLEQDGTSCADVQRREGDSLPTVSRRRGDQEHAEEVSSCSNPGLVASKRGRIQNKRRKGATSLAVIL